MSDVLVRTEGRAGRITLNRPAALNALTWEMCLEIERALDAWRDDGAVALVVIDGAPGRAFCSGGDIAELYRTGAAGDYGFGRRFWRDEYRMNRKISRFPKPVATFLHGFVMGGGVGVGCHGSHRVVGESSRVAMPECSVGLVPDVGGSLLLARAPGRLGEYLGTTGTRMGPGDAIHAGFADSHVPEDDWPHLIDDLARSGDALLVEAASGPTPESELARQQAKIDTLFGGDTLGEIVDALSRSDAPVAAEALDVFGQNSPLSMACTVELVHRVRSAETIEAALEHEYRFTSRAMEHGDFLEGIRATIIDKDRAPRWRHTGPADVPPDEVARMLEPLGDHKLDWEDT